MHPKSVSTKMERDRMTTLPGIWLGFYHCMSHLIYVRFTLFGYFVVICFPYLFVCLFILYFPCSTHFPYLFIFMFHPYHSSLIWVLSCIISYLFPFLLDFLYAYFCLFIYLPLSLKLSICYSFPSTCYIFTTSINFYSAYT